MHPLRFIILSIFVFYNLIVSSCDSQSHETFTVKCDTELRIHNRIPLEESYRVPNYYNVQLTQSYLIIDPFNSHRLFFYDLDGEIIHEINKFGSGPGDFGANRISLNYSEGKIIIHDGTNARFTIINTTKLLEQNDLTKHHSADQSDLGIIINKIDNNLYVVADQRRQSKNKVIVYRVNTYKDTIIDTLFSALNMGTITIPENNTAYRTILLNHPKIIPDGHYTYLFNTSEYQIKLYDSNKDTYLHIEIPFTWKPAYDQILYWELSHYGDSYATGKYQNQLKGAIRENKSVLSWFHDVIIREGSIWFSLMPDGDFKKKIMRFDPLLDTVEVFCSNISWDATKFRFLGFYEDQYIFLEIDEEYLASIVFAELN